MRYYVEELKGRDDYEARINQVACYICGEQAERTEYRILGCEEWKPASKKYQVECSKCRDQKVIKKINEHEAINLRERLTSRFKEEYWFIPEDLKEAGFKKFQVNGKNSVFETKRYAINYIKSFSKISSEQRHNLLIMGNPGVGKTHIAVAIARTLKDKGFLVGFLTTGTLLAKIKATYQKGASKTEEDIFKDLKKFDLLVLDDLGSEARSKDEFDWSKNKLFEIINLRIGKPTVYTTNFNEEHLPTAVGERVFSRLYNNTKFIELVSEDYRKKFQVK